MAMITQEQIDEAFSPEPGQFGSLEIAVIVPCYNEEATVAKVVQDFQENLPGARIYVYDNASSDRTAALAQEAGATVRHEGLRGKGNVVRRSFADIDAAVRSLEALS